MSPLVVPVMDMDMDTNYLLCLVNIYMDTHRDQTINIRLISWTNIRNLSKIGKANFETVRNDWIYNECHHVSWLVSRHLCLHRTLSVCKYLTIISINTRVYTCVWWQVLYVWTRVSVYDSRVRVTSVTNPSIISVSSCLWKLSINIGPATEPSQARPLDGKKFQMDFYHLFVRTSPFISSFYQDQIGSFTGLLITSVVNKIKVEHDITRLKCSDL